MSNTHIRAMIDSVGEKDFTSAAVSFNAALQDRLSSEMDSRRIEIASKIYNDVVPSDEEKVSSEEE
tara:strand:- start:382 stop:579 length:198 start_codon:yes stop_codon:yes gene_type:complete